MKFTEEQILTARSMQRDYDSRIQMIWDDMMFELEMRLGLTPEQTAQLVEKFT
jgi:hypothetical protein